MCPNWFWALDAQNTKKFVKETYLAIEVDTAGFAAKGLSFRAETFLLVQDGVDEGAFNWSKLKSKMISEHEWKWVSLNSGEFARSLGKLIFSIWKRWREKNKYLGQSIWAVWLSITECPVRVLRTSFIYVIVALWNHLLISYRFTHIRNIIQ